MKVTSVQREVFRQGRQLVRGGARGPQLRPLVGEQRGGEDSAMAADHPVLDVPLVEELDHMWGARR